MLNRSRKGARAAGKSARYVPGGLGISPREDQQGEITEVLPSQSVLVTEYGVSRSTIERALAALKADGVIESVQGTGWFVAGTGDRRPLVERVADLLCGEGKVVDRFPAEKELREQLGASRTAVRSAVA